MYPLMRLTRWDPRTWASEKKAENASTFDLPTKILPAKIA